MLRLKNIEVGLVCLVIFISLPRFCAAQTGAFPAFAPESETTPEAEPAPADARKALFPTDEGEASLGKKAAFPVETTGLPDEPQTTPAGKSLSLEEIGLLLGELNLEFSTLPQRHDFLYQADLEDQVLELFFSVYLSEDGSQLRIRAWPRCPPRECRRSGSSPGFARAEYHDEARPAFWIQCGNPATVAGNRDPQSERIERDLGQQPRRGFAGSRRQLEIVVHGGMGHSRETSGHQA
ncbi:MAG: hypothetical protein R3C12_24275 [Planctomycetaceae bacterium]